VTQTIQAPLDPSRPKVDPKALFEFRDGFEVWPSGPSDDFVQRRKVDTNFLASFAECQRTNRGANVLGESTCNLIDGIYRGHVRPIGDPLPGVLAMRPRHTTSVDDDPQAAS
jgi:hypothetical protein